MIDSHFVILGAFVGFCTAIRYIRKTLRGETQPNRVTWLLWGAAPMIAFAAELQSHVGLDSLMTFAVGFNPLLVLIASFVNPRATWQLDALDYLCGVLSVGGTIAWLVTSRPGVALAASIAADGLAALPTVRKAITHPHTESRSIYLGGVINSAVALLATQQFDAIHAAFPLYIFVLNLGLLLILGSPHETRSIKVHNRRMC